MFQKMWDAAKAVPRGKIYARKKIYWEKNKMQNLKDNKKLGGKYNIIVGY